MINKSDPGAINMKYEQDKDVEIICIFTKL